jgi:hypothetical protein
MDKDRIEKFKSMGKEYEKEEKSLLKEGLISFFEEYPEMKSFGWVQDSDYNDENDDHFTGYAQSNLLMINGHKKDYDQYRTRKKDTEYTFPVWHDIAAEEITDFLNLFRYSTLIDTFGDGIEVLVTPKGTATDYPDN